MIMKHTILSTADNSGVYNIFTFHLYKGFNRKVSNFGDYIKVSVRDTKPNNWLVKKTKKKALIIRTKKSSPISDGAYISYELNSAIILKKRLTPEGSEVIGPIHRSFKKKKFLASMSGVI